MSTRIVGAGRGLPLSFRRQFRPVARLGRRARAALVALAAFMPIFSGCNEIDDCDYRCTAQDDRCPEQQVCDTTLGYCVSEGYTGTCDAETHAITVCKDEVFSLDVPDSVSGVEDVDGLPESAQVESGRLTATFSKRTVFGFGGPDEVRQYWEVETTDDCPVIDADLPPLCVGDAISESLETRGGEGKLRFELLQQDADFSVSNDGVVSGKASAAGERALRVAVTDERGFTTVHSVSVKVSSECPDVAGVQLPTVCVGSGYEYELDLVGKPTVLIKDLTLTEKDGEQLTAAEAKRWEQELKLQLREANGSHLLTASPEPTALGRYRVNFTLSNEVSVEQRDRPLTVAECDAIPAEFTACAGVSFDFDLQGRVEDTWGFYDLNDALEERVYFVENRLRGTLDAGRYEIRASRTTPDNPAKRLTSFVVTVLPAETTACRPETSTEDHDAQTAPGPDAGDDSSAAPEPPPALPHLMGCVGEWLSFRPDVGLPNANGWWLENADDLPAGLVLDPDTGRITGTPTSAGTGSFTVNAQSPDDERLQQHLFTISETCTYAFKAVNAAQLTSLFVGHVLQTPPSGVEVLPPLVLGEGDVELFRFDPTGSRVAITTNDPSGPESRGYVARITGVDEAGAPTVETTALPLFPLPARVLEMAWSSEGVLAMLIDGDGPSPAADRRLVAFSLDSGGDWQVTFDATAGNGRELTWLGPYPCFAGTYEVEEGTFNGVSCRTPEGQNITAQGPPEPFASRTAMRASANSLLAVTPIVVDGAPPDPNYVAGLDNQTDPWAAITYRGVFASPRGDMIAVNRSGPALEVATVGSQTDFPDLGLYTPVATIEACDVVSAWSRNTGALACTLESDATAVTFVTFEGSALADTFSAEVEGHGSARQMVFVDDRFYAFDAGWGKLTIVSLEDTPSVSHIQVGPQSPSLMALATVPMAGSHSRLAVQSEGGLLIVDLDAEDVVSRISSEDAELPRVEDCVRTFQLSGFVNWCGGDEVSRAFEMTPEASHFLYLASDGGLHLSNAAGDAIIATTQCGSALNCSGNFSFAK